MLRAQGAQEKALNSGFPADEVHDIASLGHGALAYDLAGCDKLGALFLHALFGKPEQGDLAVHARVHDLAKAVFGPFGHKLHHLCPSVHDFHVEVIEPFPALPGPCVVEEGGDKVQAEYVKALVHEDFCCEQTVQAS